MTELNINKCQPSAIWRRGQEYVGVARADALRPRRAGDEAGWPITMPLAGPPPRQGRELTNRQIRGDEVVSSACQYG